MPNKGLEADFQGLFQPKDMFSPSQRIFSPKMTLETLLAKDSELVQEALEVFSGGGIWMSGTPVDVDEIESRTGRKFGDILYTPGVSAPSLELSDLHCQAQQVNTPEAWQEFWKTVDRLTPKFHRVAVVSDGTRVLGMGNIGPFAGQEVMYGKALLFSLLGGLDGEPHVLTSTEPDEIIRWVLNGQAVWGGVNLEDIESPKCFRVLEELRKRSEIAVWHDDQQGTGAVVLAALINALKVVGKDIGKVKIAFVGYGAAGVKTSEYIWAAGADPERCLCLDSGGIIHLDRKDIDWDRYPHKRKAAELTKPPTRGGPTEALKDADVVVGLSSPGSFNLNDVAGMRDKAVVFACANPIPEIGPKEAAQMENVAVIGTGGSDSPNQVNNSLFFPGAMAGALSVGSKDITDEMVVAGANTLAEQMPNPSPQAILSEMTLANMVDISPAVATAVALVAMETDVARFSKAPDEIYHEVQGRILRKQAMLRALAEAKLLR